MKPSYRVYITPKVLRPNRVDPADQDIRRLLSDPPATRQTGWIIWPTEVTFDDKELRGQGIEGAVLHFLYNAHLEYWEPLMSRRWQWGRKPEETEHRPELFAFAICEITVNFFRLARQLYDHIHLDSSVESGIDLYNIEGFVLRPYHPGIIGHDDPHFHHPPYRNADLRTGVVETESDFDPDPLALKLLERVYGQFGYGKDKIPFFDDQGIFTLAPIQVR